MRIHLAIALSYDKFHSAAADVAAITGAAKGSV